MDTFSPVWYLCPEYHAQVTYIAGSSELADDRVANGRKCIQKEKEAKTKKKKKATDKATKPLFFTFTIVMFMWLQIFDQESPPILCCGVKAAFSSFMILSDLMLDLPFMLWYV